MPVPPLYCRLMSDGASYIARGDAATSLLPLPSYAIRNYTARLMLRL